MMLLDLGAWVPILDGDPTAAAMYERHYSARRSLQRRRSTGAMLFLGPGEKLVMATPCRRALFAWRMARHRGDGLQGVECAIFRNESAGALLSSELIAAADCIADQRWPGLDHFTYVDAASTAQRRGRTAPPGQCFIRAGWSLLDRTSKARGLHILMRAAISRDIPA